MFKRPVWAILNISGPRAGKKRVKKYYRRETEVASCSSVAFPTSSGLPEHIKRFTNLCTSLVVGTIFAVYTHCLTLGSPKVHSETKIWEQVVYWGCDPGKHSEGVESEVGKARKPTKCDNEHVAPVGFWATTLQGPLILGVVHTLDVSPGGSEESGAFIHQFLSLVGWGHLTLPACPMPRLNTLMKPEKGFRQTAPVFTLPPRCCCWFSPRQRRRILNAG